MEITNTHPRTSPVPLIRILVVVEAVIFLLAALQHLGLAIPLGFATLSEPIIIPAAIVEGLSGILFVVSAFALFTSKNWAHSMTVAAHAFALFGVLLGVFSLAMSLGPATQTNAVYHMVMLLLIAPGLALLLGENARPGANRAAVFFHWLIRITGLVQIILGVLFWIFNADGLIPYHILIGLLLVISLWILAILAGRAGVDLRFVAWAIFWGLLVVVFGIIQDRLLPGSYHWVIQALHLLFGIAAIGMGEGLSARMGPR